MAKLEGVDKVIDGLDRISRAAMDALARDIPKELADSAERNLKKGTGALSSSKNYESTIKGDLLIVKSNSKIPYANIQDKGGRIRITDKMRKKMWFLYQETGNEMYKAIALSKQRYLKISATKYSRDISVDISNDPGLRREIARFNR